MKRSALTMCIAAAFASGPASALTETEANASIQFNLSNPGARSLGFGGAFIGLADDATAAYTNPAGLTQLTRPEVSDEFRHNAYDTPFVNGGGATLDPFDTSGVNYSSADSSTNSLGFISFVWPHDTWAVAVYRHQLAKFETSLEAERVDLLDPGRGFLRAFDSDVDLDIVNWGTSLAVRASEELSFGVGISYYDFDFETLSQRYRGERVEFSSFQVQSGSDHEYGLNFGARYTFNDQWSVGAVYRHGPSFEYNGRNTILLDSQNDPVDPPIVQTFTNIPFDLPDVAGAGVSYRAQEALTINLDVVRIEYGDLLRGITTLLSNDAAELAMLDVDDDYEVRLGGEYTFTNFSHPWSLRAGVWSDPNHTIGFDRDPDVETSTLAVLFSVPGERETHYAIGTGIAFENFQLDVAADFSDLVDTYSVSGVWRL